MKTLIHKTNVLLGIFILVSSIVLTGCGWTIEVKPPESTTPTAAPIVEVELSPTLIAVTATPLATAMPAMKTATQVPTVSRPQPTAIDPSGETAVSASTVTPPTSTPISAPAFDPANPCAHIVDIPQSECAALVAFYTQLQWRIQLQTNTPCASQSWVHFIGCEGQHITGLFFAQQGLTGGRTVRDRQPTTNHSAQSPIQQSQQHSSRNWQSDELNLSRFIKQQLDQPSS